MSENTFRFLGIKILENTDKKISKGLKNTLYTFYKGVLEENENEEVIVTREALENIDKLTVFENLCGKTKKINISAIVGKNGSGKSTLLEIFYIFNYNLALYFDLIKSNEKINYDYQNLYCEVYYQLVNSFFKIELNKDKVIFYAHSNEEGYFKDQTCVRFDDFIYFFNVVIDYSMYGLNEQNSPWASPLFHKNDGYKIPVVINPYRNNGNIDVNKERHLAQSRLLLNLSEFEEINPEILENKFISKIKFSINKTALIKFKNKNSNTDSLFWDSVDEVLKWINTEENSNYNFTELLNDICLGFGITDIKIPNNFELRWKSDKKRSDDLISEINFVDYDDLFLNIAKYIVKKFMKIIHTYSESLGIDTFLKDYQSKLFPEQIFFSNFLKPESNIRKELKMLIFNDYTHITLKIRQAIFTLSILNQEEFEDWECIVGYDYFNRKTFHIEKEYNWSDYQKLLMDKMPEGISRFGKIKYLPFGFAQVQFKLQNEGEFHELSSGEQHMINVIQNVIYHIRNIDSIVLNLNNIRKEYYSINIIFDEVELYFHPDYQRKFIHELHEALKNMNLSIIERINIIFSTHSPFILSDIPVSNILHIEDGKQIEKETQTFGANIHDLLANDFFLKDGFMGEFAKEKINELIIVLNRAIDRIKKLKEDKFKSNSELYLNEINQIKQEIINLNLKSKINLIGDEIIKDKLLQMYFQIIEDNNKDALKSFYQYKLNSLDNDQDRKSN